MLSVEQEAAVKTKAKRVLVAATAGAGKTKVIMERINYLLSEGIDPHDIYAITYTNNAAQEMMSRISNQEVFIGTIHSLANKILKNNGIDTNKIIEDKSFYKLLELLAEPEMELDIPYIKHLLVDEFQDICQDEYEFIMYILKAENIFICGDSCQAIYGFKGGNYQYFVDFAQDKNTTVYELTGNYRNSKKIFDFSNKYLYGMKEIYLIKTHPIKKEDGIVFLTGYSEDFIIKIINEIGNFKDWFILARTNAQVDDLLRTLKTNKIPCDTFKKSQKSFSELQIALEEDSVKVLTIHSAKGLENKYVIVVGINNWNDEERRIAYVACSRSKELLILMTKYATHKNNYDTEGSLSDLLYQTKRKVTIEHIKKYPSNNYTHKTNTVISSSNNRIEKPVEKIIEDTIRSEYFNSFADEDVINFELMETLPLLEKDEEEME